MTLKKRGERISKVEILNISPFGIWIFVRGREHFLSYEDHPWFKKASLSSIHNVECLHETHLHWPELDVDLDVTGFDQPEKYSLIYA